MMEMPQGNLREDRAGGGYAICCLVGNFFSWGAPCKLDLWTM